MKKIGQIIFAVVLFTTICFTVSYFINRTPAKAVEKVKTIDVEKVGKKVGDLKRKFLKGYRDTTTLKLDSVKTE